MIVIQTFPDTAALVGWLRNMRYRCRDQYTFTQWLHQYIAAGREITAHGKHYQFHDCIKLMRSAGI